MKNIKKCFRGPCLEEYAEETTFQGIKYVFRAEQNTCQRIFWTLALATLFVTLGCFVNISINRYFSLKIQENSQSTYIYEIPFPAITICPANKIQNFYFDVINFHDIIHQNYLNLTENEFWHMEYGAKVIMATQTCTREISERLPNIIDYLIKESSLINFEIPSYLTEEIVNELFKIAPTLLETIRECQLFNWHDKKIAVMSNENAEKLFAQIITNEGLCFTFNTVPDILRPNLTELHTFHYKGNYVRKGWDPDNGYSDDEAFPFKAIVRENDQQNGLRVILNANLTFHTERCSPRNLGYSIILHSPSEYPHAYEKFIPLEYGKDYTIAVKPETISTAKSLRSISPALRQCYFNDERQLKYYTFYNENNCQLECYANYSLKLFGGFPFSAPRDNNTRVSFLTSHNYGWHLPQYFDSASEYNKLFNTTLKNDKTMDMDCNCWPECNSIRYDHEIVKVNLNALDTLLNESKTTLEIMFDQPTFIGKERVREYTFAALVSDFGGLLGLFMGGSLISIFELFYFLVIRKI